MKLKTLLSLTFEENEITFYVQDWEDDYEYSDIFTATIDDEIIKPYLNWYVTFIDFETSSITIAER